MGRKKRYVRPLPQEPENEVQEKREPLPQVDAFVVSCPKCGGEQKEITNSIPFPRRPMKLPSGKIITGIRIQYATCNDCNQRYRIRVPLVK